MTRRNSKPKASNAVDELYDWLNEYLDSREGSAAELALACGVSRQYIYEVKKRNAVPSSELMCSLALAMGGKVVLDRGKKLCPV